MNTVVRWTRKIFATALFTGYFPFGPGTVGALITILVLFFAGDKLQFLLGPQNAFNFWLVSLALITLCIFLTSRAKETFGKDDPPQVTFDEIVGQFITFFMVPISIRTLILGFALFRFFDIIKPFPVNVMEEMEGGVGVTMDDVTAGVLANISLIFSIALYNFIMGLL